MYQYLNSDYALNKHSGAIVYRFADSIVEVTLADYLAENPSKSEDDFRKLKLLSDTDYLERDRSDYRQTWKNTNLDALAETIGLSEPSPEISVINAPDESAQRENRMLHANKALGKLTDIQRRRYLLRIIKGLTTREIAELERVSHVAVVYSLEAAEKKIKKYFGKL